MTGIRSAASKMLRRGRTGACTSAGHVIATPRSPRAVATWLSSRLARRPSGSRPPPVLRGAVPLSRARPRSVPIGRPFGCFLWRKHSTRLRHARGSLRRRARRRAPRDPRQGRRRRLSHGARRRPRAPREARGTPRVPQPQPAPVRAPRSPPRRVAVDNNLPTGHGGRPVHVAPSHGASTSSKRARVRCRAWWSATATSTTCIRCWRTRGIAGERRQVAKRRRVRTARDAARHRGGHGGRARREQLLLQVQRRILPDRRRVGGPDGIKIPYPVPFDLLEAARPGQTKGWFATTYLDERLRISRGNKGSVFVLRRPPGYAVDETNAAE